MLKHTYLTLFLVALVVLGVLAAQRQPSAWFVLMAALLAGMGWWHEYHKCPTCGSTNRAEVRVQVIEHPDRWIPWSIDGGGNRCPDPWHKHN